MRGPETELRFECKVLQMEIILISELSKEKTAVDDQLKWLVLNIENQLIGNIEDQSVLMLKKQLKINPTEN